MKANGPLCVVINIVTLLLDGESSYLTVLLMSDGIKVGSLIQTCNGDVLDVGNSQIAMESSSNRAITRTLIGTREADFQRRPDLDGNDRLCLMGPICDFIKRECEAHFCVRGAVGNGF